MNTILNLYLPINPYCGCRFPLDAQFVGENDSGLHNTQIKSQLRNVDIIQNALLPE